jgi:hypothetical protein
MIKTVIKMRNNQVMVFDESGEEIPEYKGNFDIVRDKVITEAMLGFVFNHWDIVTSKPRKNHDGSFTSIDSMPCSLIPVC